MGETVISGQEAPPWAVRRYRALLIGNSHYPDDPGNLPDLKGPVNDVSALGRALAEEPTALFAPADVRLLTDRQSYEIGAELEELLTSATRDEVLLIYYSGHGITADNGSLLLCARNSRTDRRLATTLGAETISRMIDQSAAAATIIILDCCHAGAFKTADVAAELAGRGRYVLAATRSHDPAGMPSTAPASVASPPTCCAVCWAPRPGPARRTSRSPTSTGSFAAAWPMTGRSSRNAGSTATVTPPWPAPPPWPPTRSRAEPPPGPPPARSRTDPPPGPPTRSRAEPPPGPPPTRSRKESAPRPRPTRPGPKTASRSLTVTRSRRSRRSRPTARPGRGEDAVRR
ncbi:caspase family protein [Actinoplanes sp. CA-030573]|uniref:caspase family protein n=1 Tax=Actinoplanes sp. CA-030573 TaxID=3239898 RepID=UPI003D8E17FB